MRAVLRWVLTLGSRVQRIPARWLNYHPSSEVRVIDCFCDASWNLPSVSGAIICWQCNLLKSFSRKQTVVALSSAEAELSALVETVKEPLFAGLLQQSFLEGLPEDDTGSFVIRMFTDAESANAIASMEGLLRRVRHLELRCAYLQQKVQSGRVILEFISGAYNASDGLTKSMVFQEQLDNLYEVTGLVPFEDELGDFELERLTEEEAEPVNRSFVPLEYVALGEALARNQVEVVVVELFCQSESALQKACEKLEVPYVGVTEQMDFCSSDTQSFLKELFSVLSCGLKTKLYCHISTPCTTGCRLRHRGWRKYSREKWNEKVGQAAITGPTYFQVEFGATEAEEPQWQSEVRSADWDEKAGDTTSIAGANQPQDTFGSQVKSDQAAHAPTRKDWCRLSDIIVQEPADCLQAKSAQLLDWIEEFEPYLVPGTLGYWVANRIPQCLESDEEDSIGILACIEDLKMHVGHKPKEGTCTILQANVTHYRSEVRQWLVSNQCQITCLQETHVEKHQQEAMKSGLAAGSMEAWTAGGNTGGLVSTARSHLQTRHLITHGDQGPIKEEDEVDYSSARQFLQSFRQKARYWRDNQDRGNDRKLRVEREVPFSTRLERQPYYALLDLLSNHTPALYESTSFQTDLNGLQIWSPEGGDEELLAQVVYLPFQGECLLLVQPRSSRFGSDRACCQPRLLLEAPGDVTPGFEAPALAACPVCLERPSPEPDVHDTTYPCCGAYGAFTHIGCMLQAARLHGRCPNCRAAIDHLPREPNIATRCQDLGISLDLVAPPSHQTAHTVVRDYAARTFSSADEAEPPEPERVRAVCCRRLSGPATGFMELPDARMHWAPVPHRNDRGIASWTPQWLSMRC
eukprot:s10200_g1.t1